jgi:hypothetical protein
MYYSSINRFSPKPILRSHNPQLIVQDLSIGIPLNIFSNIYTNLHYGLDITTTKSVLLQFLLGYYAYGYDRIKDANEYSKSTDISIYPQNKIDLYKRILDQKLIYDITVNSALIGSIYLLSIDNYDITHLPFLLLLYLSANYKEYKPLLSIYKPLYIAIMWTITTIGLPCVLHDNNYNILMYPQDYLSCLLFIFSASNFADINDIREDKKLGVKTLPVLYGKNITSYISLIAVSTAAILLVENPNFENRFWINSLIEAQHLGLMYVIYNNTDFTIN